MDLVVVLAAIPVIFYLLPALVPLGRTFWIVWLLIGAGVVAIWLAGPWGPFAPDAPRGLGAAIDLFINIVMTTSWFVAGIVQGVRWYAGHKGWGDYRHWITVIIGLLVIVPFVLVWA